MTHCPLQRGSVERCHMLSNSPIGVSAIRSPYSPLHCHTGWSCGCWDHSSESLLSRTISAPDRQQSHTGRRDMRPAWAKKYLSAWWGKHAHTHTTVLLWHQMLKEEAKCLQDETKKVSKMALREAAAQLWFAKKEIMHFTTATNQSGNTCRREKCYHWYLHQHHNDVTSCQSLLQV